MTPVHHESMPAEPRHRRLGVSPVRLQAALRARSSLPLRAHAQHHSGPCHLQSQREVKRFFKREKREQQHREQAAAAEANAFQLPRSALGAP